MANKKIVMIAGQDPTTNIVYHYLSKSFEIETVIVEKPKSVTESLNKRWRFIKRRMKKLGLFTVIGQILFSLLIDRKLRKESAGRIQEIIQNNGLCIDSIPDSKRTYVKTHNSQETVELLKKLNPDVVIVYGTAILKEFLLKSVPCAFINTHVGITPKYRGVHGMYWALANQDADNAGVTVHFVDKGIDTGKVINQARTIATADDNFATYPYLQIAEGVKILSRSVSDYLEGMAREFTPPKESKLYSHPTIWQYLRIKRKYGVK